MPVPGGKSRAGRARLDAPGRARRVHPARRLRLPRRRSGRHRRPYPGGLPPAGLLSPPPHPRIAAPRHPGRPAGQPRQRLQKAWEAKDITTLIGVLDPGATAIADTGGLASALLGPIEGGEQVAGACAEVARIAPGLTLLERTVNGQPGLVAQQDGVTVTVIAFDVAGDRIKRIWAVRNPESLRPWTTG
jgi:hypothetical protein